ncbi:MAG: ferritin-like domain-containing protein [Polyangiaceae bacterium]|jgi:hypothetical protein
MERSRDNPVDAPLGAVDTWLKPIHRWVWKDPLRRAHKLLVFAETEADGGRDLARAAELTNDAVLRGLYLRHAMDEQRHAEMFRQRGRTMLSTLSRRPAGLHANWLSPGERGLDGVVVEKDHDEALLAFLHLSERAAARRFAVYRDVLGHDPETRAVFTRILRDEVFHMTYSRKELGRISPRRHGLRLWAARLHRIWKAYLRLAAAVAGVMGTCVLALQYFVILPWFALLAKRAARKHPAGLHGETPGWTARGARPRTLRTQY